MILSFIEFVDFNFFGSFCFEVADYLLDSPIIKFNNSIQSPSRLEKTRLEKSKFIQFWKKYQSLACPNFSDCDLYALTSLRHTYKPTTEHQNAKTFQIWQKLSIFDAKHTVTSAK